MTSTERHPAWSERLNPRNWSLAAKLVAVGLVPTLLALVLGVLRISDQAGVAEQLGRDNRLLEIRQDVSAAAQALQAERNTAVLFVAGGRTGDRGALTRAAADTDARLGEVRAALADTAQLDASGTTALQQAEGGFTQLPVLRTDAAGSPAGIDDITTRYTTIVQRTDVLDRALIHQGETTYAGGLGDALTATGEAREALALQHTVLAGAIAAGRLSEQDKITVTGAAAAFATAFADYQVGLTPEQFARFGNFATDGANVDFERLRTQIMATPTDRPLAADPAAWDAAYQQAAQVVERAGSGVGDELTATSTQAQEDASNKAGVNSVLLMLGVLLGIAIIVLLARSLIRSLRVLRRSALDVAERRLPQAVETMRSGQPLDAMVEPVPLAGRDEVGQVARAFDAVHGQAIRLAADQAALQANVSNMFVNLSRRSQALVERQLQLIEQLESNEQDPDQLSNLFQLDHLATRMRRNSENLLVLAGTDLAKRNVAPVPVVDVLRAAVSEIEQYQRVVVQPPPVATVAGRAASDLVHLLAELLDNATNFSPPDSQVVMSTTRVGDGSLIIEIADRGVGMAEHELGEANQRLASPAAVDVSASRRMGLFVVGRLANRHGLGIRLAGGMAGAAGGLTASVTVPAVLVPSAEPVDRQPVRTGAAPAALAAGQGASSFGGGPTAPGTGTVPAPRPAGTGPGRPSSLSSLVQGDDGPMSPAPAFGGGGRPPAPPVNGKGLPQRRPGSVPPQDGAGPDDGFDAFGTGAVQAERPDEPSDEATRPERAAGDPATNGYGPGRGPEGRGSAGQVVDGQVVDGQEGRQAPDVRPAGPERGPWPVESLRRPPNGSAVPTRPTNGHSFHGDRPGASGDLPALPKRTPRGGTPGDAERGTREQERTGDRPTGREQGTPRGGAQPDEALRNGTARNGAVEDGTAAQGAAQEDPQKSGSDRPGEKLGRGVAAAGAALAGAAAGLAGAAALRKSGKDGEEKDTEGKAERADSEGSTADAPADDRTPPAGSAAADADTPATGTAAARDGSVARPEAGAATSAAEAGAASRAADEPATTRLPVTRANGSTPSAFSPTGDAATTVPSSGTPDAATRAVDAKPAGESTATRDATAEPTTSATGSESTVSGTTAGTASEAASSGTDTDAPSGTRPAGTSGSAAVERGGEADSRTAESRGAAGRPTPGTGTEGTGAKPTGGGSTGTDSTGSTGAGVEGTWVDGTGTGERAGTDRSDPTDRSGTGAAFAAGAGTAFAGAAGIRSGRTGETAKSTSSEGTSTESTSTKGTSTESTSTEDTSTRGANTAGTSTQGATGGSTSGSTPDPAAPGPVSSRTTTPGTGAPSSTAAESADPAERTDAIDTTAARASERASGADATGAPAAGGAAADAPDVGDRTSDEPAPPTAAGLPRRTPAVNSGERPDGPPSALPRRGGEPEDRPERPAAATSESPESAAEGLGLPRRTPGTPGRTPADRTDRTDRTDRADRTDRTDRTDQGDRPGGAPAAPAAPAAGVEGSQGLPRRVPGTSPGADGRSTAHPTGPAGLPQRRPDRPMSASAEGTEALFSASTPADTNSTGQLRRPGAFELRTPSGRPTVDGATDGSVDGATTGDTTGTNGTAPTGPATAGGPATPAVEQTGGTAPTGQNPTGQNPTGRTGQNGTSPAQDPTGGPTAPRQAPRFPAGQGPTGQNPLGQNPLGQNTLGQNPATQEPGTAGPSPYRNGGALAYGTGTPGAPGMPNGAGTSGGLPTRRPSPGPQATGPSGTTGTGPSSTGTGSTGTGATGPTGTGPTGTGSHGTLTGEGPTGTAPGSPSSGFPGTGTPAPSAPGGVTSTPTGTPAAPLGAASTAPTGGRNDPTDDPSRFDLGQTTPIFEEIASAWFRSNRSVPVRWTDAEEEGAQGAAATPASGDPLRADRPAGGPGGFATAADEGWRVADATAAATAAETERGASETTEAGLPKRRPRARLVPGSAAGSAVLAPPSGPARNAEAIRGRLASYQQGVRQGRESRLRRQSAAGGTGQARSTTEQDEEK
ncbi:hypothetical protein GCM10023215_57570 [Pseudonocardia yuanmonensis]|uniref:histidine kinase n=1 Tax=Pseudonocardia yuanmonensis TaxID=1095914 RepID=A0ABP8XIA9_9PSEU